MVQVRKLRQGFREFQTKNDIGLLLREIQDLSDSSGGKQATKEAVEKSKQLKREDLRLICFDLLTSG
jgi:hypothetical protein